MFSKLAVLVATSMAVFVAAVPGGGINKSCNTGPVQCCNSLTKTNENTASFFMSKIGVDVPIGAVVGTQCSPLSAIGVGGGSKCQSQPVCCDSNHMSGLIAVGCSPVNANI